GRRRQSGCACQVHLNIVDHLSHYSTKIFPYLSVDSYACHSINQWKQDDQSNFSVEMTGDKGMKSIEHKETRIKNYGLWTVQCLLALLFLWAGGVKLVLPLEMLKGPVALPGLFVRFIGVADAWRNRIDPPMATAHSAGADAPGRSRVSNHHDRGHGDH